MDRWKQLDALVRGRVLRPGNPGFEAAGRPFNDRFQDVRPAGVLTVTGAADIAAALRWSQEHGVPLTTRASGHSYAGASTGTGLILDLSRLDAVRVDPRTRRVTVGGGARTGAIHAVLRRYGLIMPLGNADDVAIGGLTLGGGVSVVSRAYGLVCDALLETELVLADGSTVTAGAGENPDLLWAARGGGGNFGVHTSFTFQARPVPAATSTCLLLWDWHHAPAVLAAMQKVMTAAPRGFSARIGASRAPGQQGLVSVIGQHLGPADELRRLLGPALLAASPSRTEIADRSYWESAEYLHHATSGGAFAVRTRCLPGPLGEAAVQTLLTAVEKWPGGANPDGAGFALFAWGGAIGDVPATATAFPHRDTVFLLSMDTSWSATDPAETRQEGLAWLTTLYEEAGAFAPDASYVNFADPDLSDPSASYYGPNLARLRALKDRYDPHRVFGGAQALQPAHSSSRERLS